MEIILWIAGIALGIVLLKFLWCFIIQLIGIGLVFGLLSIMVCGVLTLFDIMEWETCLNIAQYAFYIGTAIGVIRFLCHPIDTLSEAFDLFDDNSSSTPRCSSNSSMSNYEPEAKGTVYNQTGHLSRTGDGRPNCIDLEDGRTIYIYDDLGNGRVQDQHGDLWDISGNNARRV